MCATTGSATPLFPNEWIKCGAHVTAVGSYEPHTSELEPNLVVRAATLLVDSPDAWTSGDIGLALERGLVEKQDAVTLGQVLAGRKSVKHNPKGFSLYKSVGTSVQDIITASKLYQSCLKDSVGTFVEL